MGKTQLVVCGSIAIDRIMNFSGNYLELIDAAQLEVLSLSVLVESLQVSEGGIGANIAHYVAALGEEVTLLGSVGKDAADYIQRLSQRGINTERVHQSNLPTASFNVLTDSAGNQVGGFYSGAMGEADSLSFMPWVKDRQDTLFCISAHDPAGMRRQLEECLEHSLRVMYDPGQQTSTLSAEDLRLGIRAAEVVITNAYELSLLCSRTGMTAEELQSSVPLLITTHGKGGSEISGTRLPVPVKIKSAAPTEIIDPTGAGDAYRAGFLYGYLRQWDVQQCGQLGSVVASFALEHHGPQSPLSRDAVRTRYQETFNERIEL